MVEYLTELIEAILVVALLAQTRLMTFGGRVIFVIDRRNPGGNRDQCFLLELVRLSQALHRRLHVHRDRRLLSRGHCRRIRFAKENLGAGA